VLKKVLLIITILAVAIVFIVLSPRFLFRQARISHELSIREEVIPLDESREGIRIADYRGRWDSMYAKLELTPEKYDQVKQRLLMFYGSKTNKDFTDEILSEESMYSYDPTGFYYSLRYTNNAKNMRGYHSLNLDDYEELIIMQTTYAKYVFIYGTTGGKTFILAKESNGNCYLYIIKG